MDEELEHITDRVNRTEDARAGYIEMARRWEKMWRLDPGYSSTLAESVEQGREQITTPLPYNIVNLSQRLLSTIPEINVTPHDIADREAVENAGQCEKWLGAYWKANNRVHRRNVIADVIWYGLVYGRFATDTRWVQGKLPKLRQKRQLPIITRALNPLNVGSHQGPSYTEYVYHKYQESILDVLRRYPELKEVSRTSELGRHIAEVERDPGNESIEVNVIDYWDIEPDSGKVRNAIIVEDEWAKELMDTDYPDLPIVVGRGDHGVGLGDEWDGLSILHNVDGLWQYQCRLVSQMATGLLWHFWPAVMISNDEGHAIDDIEVGPGHTTYAPPGTNVDLVQVDPNVPLAQTVHDQVDRLMQQSSYPEVMYGQAPAELQAGYGVALLADSAKGRIKSYQESLEMVLADTNSLTLALVEKFGGKKGVSIVGYSDTDSERYSLTLTKSMVNGNYENEVRITPGVPADDARRITEGLRLAESKKISDHTFRDKFVGMDIPSDEARRIALEEAMQSDELRMFRMRRALEEYYGPDEAMEIMYNTPMMPEPPPGMQWIRNEEGDVELVDVPQQGPDAGIPGAGGPQAPPPNMGQGPGAGGLPPGPGPQGPGGMVPPGGPPVGPQPGPPGGIGPPGPIQPPQMMTTAQGGGIPPAMQGMMEAENLGLPPDVDPMLLQELLGDGLPRNEMLDRMGGMQ